MKNFDKVQNKLIVYLADLDHVQPSNRYFIPLGIGSIASYCKSLYGDALEITLFKNPDKLIEKIRERPPHVLGCSFYTWNVNLTLMMMRAAKAVSQDIITVIGGPNTARNCDRYKDILKNNSSLDIIVLDQGEKSFANIIDRIWESGEDEKIFSRAIDGCASRLFSSSEVVRGDTVMGGVDINTFPSPYLAGFFDKFLHEGFVTLFETVRGCPHQCTFCGGGVGSFMPLSVRDEKVVYKEIMYVASRAKTKAALIADTNFGIMGERDLRISAFMLDLYRKTGFPQFLYYNLTKNQTKTSNELLMNMTEMVGNLQFALQTLTPEVLENCRRINIPIAMVEEIIDINRKNPKPVPVMVDLIFGLPGEDVKSYMETVNKVLALGIEFPSTLMLKMLPGTTMAETDREKYGYKTKFRPISGRYGEYKLFDGQKPIRIVETEEMACSNNYYNFSDYLKMRNFSMVTRLLSSSSALADTVFYLASRGIMITDIFQMIMDNLPHYPRLKKLFADYEWYSKNELFESEEELYRKIANDDQQWNNLLSGSGNFFKLELGFVSYCIFEETEILEDIQWIIHGGVKDRLSPEDLAELREVTRHDELFRIIKKRKSKSARRLTEDELDEKIEADEIYDYAKWCANKFLGHAKDYPLAQKTKKVYQIERVDLLNQIISRFANLTGYLFYEKIMMWGPRSLKRLCQNNDSLNNSENLMETGQQEKPNIITIIPARGGSKGIPGKNIIDFCGKPLLAWSVLQAKGSKYVNEVYVSTDSAEIARVAIEYGAKVIDRPAEISGDTATSESALLHTVDKIEADGNKVDYVVFLQATSPIRETKDIDNAIETIIKEKADSLFSAVDIGDFYIWKKDGDKLESINYDYKNRKRRQDYGGQYGENGSIYMFTPEVLRRYSNRFGEKIAISLMEEWKTSEIDDPEDIDFCALIFKNKGLNKK